MRKINAQVLTRVRHDPEYGILGEVISLNVNGRIIDFTSDGMGNKDPMYKELKEAAKFFESAVQQQDLINELAEALKDACKTISGNNGCCRICKECHVYMALSKVKS